MGAGEFAVSVHFYTQLSYDLRTSRDAVSKSVDSLQDQISSLATVVLQQAHVSNLLTAKKGDTAQCQGKNVVIL